MTHTLENGRLTIFVEGEINTLNADEVEKDIENILANSDFSSLALDFNDLTYISSAGLRIIVRLKQQYSDTSLVRVPAPVYNVLDMVGFQNMMNIERL